MLLLVPAYPGCPGSKAVKRSLLLLFLAQFSETVSSSMGICLSKPEVEITVTKFATFVHFVCGNLCSKYCYKWTTHTHTQPFNGPFPGLSG